MTTNPKPTAPRPSTVVVPSSAASAPPTSSPATPTAQNPLPSRRRCRHTLLHAVRSIAILSPALRAVCQIVVAKFRTPAEFARAKIIVEGFLGCRDDVDSWQPMAGLLVRFVQRRPAGKVGPPLATECRMAAIECYEDSLSLSLSADFRRRNAAVDNAVTFAAAALTWQYGFAEAAELAEQLLEFDRGWGEVVGVGKKIVG